MKWDPTKVFGCHHCGDGNGDEQEPEDVTKETLSYWRNPYYYYPYWNTE